MQITSLYPASMPNDQDERTRAIDWYLDAEARRRSIERIKLMVRDEERAAMVEELEHMLGPWPKTADDWARRGQRCLEISMVPGLLDGKAAAAHSDYCLRMAAVADPQRFGRATGNAAGDMAAVMQALESASSRVRKVTFEIGPGGATVEGEARDVTPKLP